MVEQLRSLPKRQKRKSMKELSQRIRIGNTRVFGNYFPITIVFLLPQRYLNRKYLTYKMYNLDNSIFNQSYIYIYIYKPQINNINIDILTRIF